MIFKQNIVLFPKGYLSTSFVDSFEAHLFFNGVIGNYLFAKH